MRMDEHEVSDGRRVWLDPGEVDRLIGQTRDPEEEVAITLAAYSGLRRDEVVQVTRNDIDYAPDGFIRVQEDYAKFDKYRETVVPGHISAMVRGMGIGPDEPLVDAHDNTFYRWVKRAAERCHGETGDAGWEYVTPHDLRRTWASRLLFDCGVLPAVVMSWGGWEDWPTFRDRYMGEMSPKAAERERAKAFGDEAGDGPVFEPAEGLEREYVAG